MNTILYMVNNTKIGLSEIMIILLALIVIFLVMRNLIAPPKY
ncbi:hypothetical protein [Pedobacter cryoconitis]|nr:hypothetical protein [Pedobacter cryoconitis]MBB5643811.1 hypothetical protein [Pedobacter cryoconitis]